MVLGGNNKCGFYYVEENRPNLIIMIPITHSVIFFNISIEINVDSLISIQQIQLTSQLNLFDKHSIE